MYQKYAPQMALPPFLEDEAEALAAAAVAFVPPVPVVGQVVMEAALETLGGHNLFKVRVGLGPAAGPLLLPSLLFSSLLFSSVSYQLN